MDRSNRSAGASSRPGGTFRRVVAAGLLAAGATLGAAAFAQHGGHGMGGPGLGMMGGGGMFMGRPEHMNRMLDRWLDGVNASDAQRAQIKQIALAAATDLRAQRESGRGLRDEGLQLLAAPTIDAAAAESLRQRMLARHDQASRRITQAMLDTANVLTPEPPSRCASACWPSTTPPPSA